MKDKTLRYIIFLIGLFINSLGVSLITKASLGTSPISSIPYVLSLNFPFTLGNFTIFFSVLLIVLQLFILRKNFKLEHLLQIPISILFGYFIDFTMIMLAFVQPQNYIIKVIDLLIGCVILGFGVYMEVLADVAMLPGESFVRAVVETWKTDFGITKIFFDVSMSVIAVVLSFVLAGRLDGVREGTIIAALLVGFIARVFGRKLAFVKAKLFPAAAVVAGAGMGAVNTQTADGSDTDSNAVAVRAKRPDVIVIGRQYGCGGSEFGRALAEYFDYDFYDKEIIQMTAGTTGYVPEFIKKQEETMTNSLLYDLVNQMYIYSAEHETSKDRIFTAESKVIGELAARGKCVIVGRCADYILRDAKNCLRIFLQAPLDERVRRVMERENLSQEEAREKIRKEDHYRTENYRYYTGQMWGAAANYDLCYHTGYGVELLEDTIEDMMRIER